MRPLPSFYMKVTNVYNPGTFIELEGDIHDDPWNIGTIALLGLSTDITKFPDYSEEFDTTPEEFIDSLCEILVGARILVQPIFNYLDLANGCSRLFCEIYFWGKLQNIDFLRDGGILDSSHFDHIQDPVLANELRTEYERMYKWHLEKNRERKRQIIARLEKEKMELAK